MMTFCWVFWAKIVQILMGVINLCDTSSLCVVKHSSSFHSLERRVPICAFEGRRKGITCMNSSMPVNQATEVQERLTGDSFIRTHLRTLSPYQPILPFEVIQTNPFIYIYIYILFYFNFEHCWSLFRLFKPWLHNLVHD